MSNQPDKKIHPYHEEIAEARAHIPRKTLFINNMIGGIGWGLGSVLGATLIVGILGMILSYLGQLPGIGRFVGRLMQAIQEGISQVR